jgi:hypothetical protein
VSRQNKEYPPEKASRQFGGNGLRVWVIPEHELSSLRAKPNRSFVAKKGLDWLDWLVEKEFFPAEGVLGAKGFESSTAWSR